MSNWQRLTPGDEDSRDVVIARYRDSFWHIVVGFQDHGQLRRYPNNGVILDTREMARLLELVRESAE